VISKKTLGCLAVACALPLSLAAGASARAGDLTFDQTYPVASALCVKAHNYTLPARLAASRTQVIAACDALVNAFGPLVSTADAAESAYLNTVGTERNDVSQVCTRPVADHTVCFDARQSARSTDSTAATTRVTAVSSFRSSIEANRATFWTTVAGLRQPPSDTTGATGSTGATS
jgi:hypothetical protein